jgi:predicted nuclease of predicted toxin-antitoxin system
MNGAQREHRLLLTEDKDFGDSVFRQARPVPGLVLVRIDPSRRSLKGPRLLAAIDRFGETLFGRYTVVEDARFRSRPLRSL